jgi:sugar transferase (PEP-CTERM system associated)
LIIEQFDEGCAAVSSVSAGRAQGFFLPGRRCNTFVLKIGGQQIPRRTILLAFSEGLLVLSGLLVAIAIKSAVTRERWQWLRVETLIQIGIVALVCEICLYYHDIYDAQMTRSRSATILRLLESFGFSSLTLAFLFSALPAIAINQGVAVIATLLSIAMIIGWRLLIDATGVMSRRAERVVVLGTGTIGIAAVREICSRPELNVNVVGFLDEDPRNVVKPLVNPGIIGTTADLEQIVEHQKIERVVISLMGDEESFRAPLLRLKFAGIAIEDAGALLERITGRLSMERTSWLILSDGFRQSRLVYFAKRVVDVLLSSFLLLVALPVMTVIGVAIVSETGFPVLFRQRRVGLGGQPFEILKFRSMCHNAEDRGPSWAADADRRITPVGRVIRKFRLDELPQLWNVLRGDMSLVGPRPEQPYFCELLEKEVPFFAERCKVRPGITGWAQIKYAYGASIDDARRKLELDLFYIKHRSMLLDAAILLETVKVVVSARGSK